MGNPDWPSRAGRGAPAVVGRDRRPAESYDDAERIVSKGCVLVLFACCLTCATVGAVAAIIGGKVGLAVYWTMIGWWLWEGLTEVERRYQLREAVQSWKS